MYWKQISAYRVHFVDAQILPLFLEDFKDDPAGVMRRCFQFLGVDADFRVLGSNLQRNRSSANGLALRMASACGLGKLVRELFPEWMVSRVRNGLSRPIEKPEWLVDTKRWVIRQVADDARRFLSYCGKPVDFWELGDGAS